MKPYYQDALVTLYHGNALELSTKWSDAAVMVTDPPYGVNHSSHGKNEPTIVGEMRTGRSSRRVLTSEHTRIRDDVHSLWGEKPALIFGSWRAPRPHNTRFRLIWDKQIPGMGGVGIWKPQDEEIYVCGDWPNPRTISRTDSSVLHFRALRGKARPAHPTPKPVDLMEYLIERSPEGVVVDPFAGSGSTLVAATRQGRRSIGIEIEERYCELTATRLASEACKQPALEEPSLFAGWSA